MRSINLPYAKSIANRALLLKAVHGEPLPEPAATWAADTDTDAATLRRRVQRARPTALAWPIGPPSQERACD